MTRLQTVRSYFIERFFTTLTNDPRLTGLRYPAELFDAQGNFAVSADVAGFVRIPSFANLEQRIAAAPAGQERSDLTTFLGILRLAYNQITGGLGTISFADAQNAVAQLAPVVRHPDDQTYFPAAVDSLLNYQDGTLTARYYSTAGQSPLSGRIYDLMFENASIPSASAFPEAPYVSRLPFVATVGLGASGPGFPATPLGTGSLDLASADARLTPGRMQPTLYAEVKRLPGAMVLNQLYQQAAQMPGRFAALRNNRIHLDPLPAGATTTAVASASTAVSAPATAAPRHRPSTRHHRPPRAASHRGAPGIQQSLPALTQDSASEVRTGNVPPETGPFMVVYHGLYPVDDCARRRPTIGATDREFHHLAMGVMLFVDRGGDVSLQRQAQTGGLRNAFVFACYGPDLVRMMPMGHPSLEKCNDRGELDPNGAHVILYSIISNPGSWQYADQPSDANKSLIQDSVAKDAPWAGRLLGGATFVGFGAGIGFAAGGPIGAAAGAAIALLVYVLISLACLLFGCGAGDSGQFQQSPAFDPPASGNSFTQSGTNDIAPQGVSQPSGGSKPARTFDLRVIPHFFDRNLYGLLAGGNATLQVVDDQGDQETLGWHAFPAGIGYQFDREVPGAIDISGSSIRNYFDLFARKYAEVMQAQAAITYFT